MSRVAAIINVLRKGFRVANPTAWRKGQVTGNVIGVAFLAITEALRAFGVADLPYTTEEALLIGTGIFAFVNPLLTTATDDEIGLPSKPKPNPGSPRAKRP